MSLINPEQIQGGGTGGGITPSQHETLRQLIHFIDDGPGDGFASGAYKIVTPSPSVFPTYICWYTNNTMSQKIVDKTLTWQGPVPITIIWQVYNTDGVTVAHTVTDNVVYIDNIFEVSRVRIIT